MTSLAARTQAKNRGIVASYKQVDVRGETLGESIYNLIVDGNESCKFREYIHLHGRVYGSSAKIKRELQSAGLDILSVLSEPPVETTHPILLTVHGQNEQSAKTIRACRAWHLNAA